MLSLFNARCFGVRGNTSDVVNKSNDEILCETRENFHEFIAKTLRQSSIITMSYKEIPRRTKTTTVFS